MALNIVVCVKSTPTTANVQIDAATGKVKTAGLTYGINPFDEFAVEEAVRVKERVPGATATALSLGPEAAADAVLRDAISRGCDAGVMVTGAQFQDAGPYLTSMALAAAIKKLHAQKPVHLVLFGKNTNDYNSGVVGSEAAAWLDWPGLLSIKKIDAIDEASATVWRMMEDGTEVLKVKLPACLSTVKEINEPRLPSLKGKMASKKASIPKWTAADLGLAPEQLATETAVVLHMAAPPPRPAGMRVDGASSAEKAKKLVDVLIERKLI